jgi:hypothetical protein
MGTYVITPMSADKTPIYDVSSLVQETLCFKYVIPESVNVGTSVNFSVIQSSATASYAVKKYNDTNKTWTTETTPTITSGSASFATAGLYAITAAATGYSSWTTTVRVVSAT